MTVRHGAPIGGVNSAASFDGSDDSIDAGSIDIPAAAMTIVAWVKADAFTAPIDRILSKANGLALNNHYWTAGSVTWGGNRRLFFSVKTDSGGTKLVLANSGTLSPGVWAFVAAVYDGVEMILYKDGSEIGRTNKTGNLTSAGGVSTWIGDNPSGTGDAPFDGVLDEVALFDHALSPLEIAAMYYAALNPVNPGGGGVTSIPTLWGVDEDDDELFSLSDYTDPSATFTSYGGLKWDNGGTISPIGRFILAAAIDDTGTLYMARNRALGGFQAPVLLKFNLNNVSTTQDNVAAVVGTVRTGVGLLGLCFDPTDSSLYGVRQRGQLYVIDPAIGNVLSSLGRIAGSGETVRNAEAMFFDDLGNLYVMDNSDDELYQVNKLNARILAVYAQGGLGGNYEGATWDHLNNRSLSPTLAATC